MIEIEKVHNTINDLDFLYHNLSNGGDKEKIKDEIQQKELNSEELTQWENLITKEKEQFNINILSGFDLETYENITPWLYSFMKERPRLLLFFPEWTQKVYDKLIYKSLPQERNIEDWINDLESHIIIHYQPLMKMCYDRIGFNNDKEIIKRDLRLKLSTIYYPYVKNDKLFVSKSATHNSNDTTNSGKLVKKEGGKVTNNSLDIPLKDTANEMMGNIGMIAKSAEEFKARLIKSDVVSDRDLQTTDDNYGESHNSGEGMTVSEHLDLGKIAWINNLIEEFKHERIKVLDRYFYWSSF